MNTAAIVIEKFGGVRALAKTLGHKHPTTVQGWRESGFIPAQRQREVLDAAERLGIALTAEDLIPKAPTDQTEGDEEPKTEAAA